MNIWYTFQNLTGERYETGSSGDKCLIRDRRGNSMRQQQSGKILNVSSIGGKVWEPLGAWYHAAKFAVEGFSDCLRMELRPFGIGVIVIEPGAIRTEWGQVALDTLQQASGQTVYRPQAEEKRALFLAAADSASDPDVVAREIIKAVKARRPKTRSAVGASRQAIGILVDFHA